MVTGEPKTRPSSREKAAWVSAATVRSNSRCASTNCGFDSKQGQDPPFRNTRAETVFPNSDSVWTGGFTYRANRWVKIQGNAIHESISDPERAPTPTDSDTPIPKWWSAVLRFQFEIDVGDFEGTIQPWEATEPRLPVRKVNSLLASRARCWLLIIACRCPRPAPSRAGSDRAVFRRFDRARRVLHDQFERLADAEGQLPR